MNTQKKQRLAGLTVVVVFFVVVMPMLFRQSTRFVASKSTAVPGAPPVIGLVAQTNPLVHIDVEHLRPTALKSDANPWFIQLAAFQHEANAQSLVVQLKQRHYPAFMGGASSAGGVFKVFVGPQATKIQAQRAQEQINHAFHLQGVLVRNNGVGVHDHIR